MMSEFYAITKSRSTLWRQARAELARLPDSVEGLEQSDTITPNATLIVDSDRPMFGDCISEPHLANANNGITGQPICLDYITPLDDDFGSRRWLDSDSESGSNSDEDRSAEETISQQLAAWAVQYHIQQSAVGSLLKILSPHFPHLPRDCRTLLKVPSHCAVKSIHGGQYCHVGLEKGLSQVVNKYLSSSAFDHLDLQINVDGIPLFHSSSSSLWPILCLVKNITVCDPFVVGIFCGKEKPGSAAEYLSDFVSEATGLLKNGLCFGNKTYAVKIHSFVCDAPARAFIKGIKSHSGYSSCEKCTVRGQYCGKVIFPSVDDPLRSDEDFNAMADEEHHLITCPLNPLPIGCVTQFGLDYMHLACLGVMRRFLLYWKGPVGPLSVRLGRNSISELSKRMLLLAPLTPVEFARKPRTLDELPRWKATELRQFLLYSGPVVLDGILPESLYKHFMILFVGLRILASKQLAPLYTDYANKLLVTFVKDAEILYGKEALVYNVHSLVHLAADVQRLGCLDDFSAFVFENKLGQLKKLIRKPQYPIQQVLKRLDEQQSYGTVSHSSFIVPVTKVEHCNGPILPYMQCAKQYKRLQTDKFSLSLSNGNNCIMISKGIPALVRNIIRDRNDVICLICAKFKTVLDAFSFPLPSSKLSMCKVESELPSLFVVSLQDIVHKCVCWPVIDKIDCFIVLPLLH